MKPRNRKLLTRAAAALALSAAMPMLAAPANADARSDSNAAYVKGFQSFQGGDYRTARIEFLKALKSNPNNGLARVLQARVALEMGGGVAAQTELERAVQAGVPEEKLRHLKAHALLLQNELADAMDLLDPKTIPPQFAAYAARLRGRILYQQQRPEKAAAEFALAQRLAPKDPDTLIDVARFKAASGDLPVAETLVDRVVAGRPTNVKALLLKGDIVRRSQGLEPALPYFNRAIEVDPNNVEALLERAATLGDLKREEEARKDLKRVQNLVPEHPLGLYLGAVLEMRAGQYEKARNLMTRTKGTLEAYVPALILQGMLAYQANDTSTAASYFSKVVAAQPQSALARKLYAAAQLRGNDAKGAIDTLAPLVDRGAADGRTYALYGSALARDNRMEDAQTYLQKAVEETPDAGQIRTQLAMTQMLQGNTDAAEAGLLEVLKEDSKSLQALMVLSLIQIREKDYKAALVTTNRIVKLYPDMPVGYNIRGGAELGAGDRKKAEASFRAALAKKPDYAEARRNLAQVLVATGKFAEAERELKLILETDKQDAAALAALADLAGQQGKTNARIGWLRQAAAADGSKLKPRAQLALAYLDTNQKKQALDEVSSLLRDFPEDPQAILTAARVYEQTGDTRRLSSALNRLVSIRPSSAPPRVMLARSFEETKRPADARTTLERSLSVAGMEKAQIYAELIAFEMRQSRPDAAKSWAERFRKEDAKSPLADLALGQAYIKAKNPTEALKHLEAARKIKFTDPVARAMSSAYVALNRPRDGIAILQAYQKANPRDTKALVAIAELQLGQKQYKAAIANYEALLKIDVASPVVLNNLAWAYSMVGDKRALGIAKRAYAAGSGIPSVMDTYAWILLRNKENPKLALNLLKRAVARQPSDPDMRYHLAVAHQVNGEREEAVKVLKTALKSRRFESRARAEALLKSLQAG